MVDINLYRSRIGTFSRHRSDKVLKFRKYQHLSESDQEKRGKAARDALKILFKVVLIYSFFHSIMSTRSDLHVLNNLTPTCWRISATTSPSWPARHRDCSSSWTQLCQKFQIKAKTKQIIFWLSTQMETGEKES